MGMYRISLMDVMRLELEVFNLTQEHTRAR